MMKTGVTYCDNCGLPVPLFAKRCPHCGRLFDAVRCPECGFNGEPSLFMKGCPSCGFLTNKGKAKKKGRGGSREQIFRKTLPPLVYRITLLVLTLLLVLFIFILYSTMR
ncbi:MAG: hypothetical protein KAU17_03150 [Spirochaetales bacterium]|nr:hypothetical protein [Spirochaetales bacterium]